MVFTNPSSKVAGLLFCFIALKQVRGDLSPVNVSTTISTTTMANNGIEGLPKFALMTNCSGADLCVGVTYSDGTQDMIKVDHDLAGSGTSENFYHGIVASTKAQAVVTIHGYIEDEEENTMELKFESSHINGCSWFGVFLKGSRPVECLDRSPGNSNEDDLSTQEFQDKSRSEMRSSGVSPSKWMSKVSNSTPLSQMSIPGTHDAGTGDWWCARTPASFARSYMFSLLNPAWPNFGLLPLSLYAIDWFCTGVICQDLSIKKQLESGVRVLDIRLVQYEDWFYVYHGRVYMKITFGVGVLTPVKKFLNDNPSETVIISYQREKWGDQFILDGSSTESFEVTFNKYIDMYLRDMAYTSETIPTLGSVRGKVVFVDFYNHGGRNQGLMRGVHFNKSTIENNWEPDCMRCIPKFIGLQPRYFSCFGYCTDYINSLKNHLQTAMTELSSSWDKLYITYLSATTHPPTMSFPNPKVMAQTVNPKIKDFIEDRVIGAVKHMGIVMFDFVNLDLARTVYQTNYLIRKPSQSDSGECRAKISWMGFCNQKSNNCKSGYHAKLVHRASTVGGELRELGNCQCKCCNDLDSSGDFCGPEK